MPTPLQRTANTNVGFVNLFKRHNKPWMNGKVRSVNLRLDLALMRCGMSHIGIIDTASVLRNEYAAHGLHFNSSGKRRLTHLIVERVKLWSCNKCEQYSMLEPLSFFFHLKINRIKVLKLY
jgi:hypothetical protein